MNRVLVCGVGNKLKSDDGLGPFVVEQLETRDLPEGVSVADFGISGFKCALHLENYDKVIFVDAISLPGCEPGRLHKIKMPRQAVLDSPTLGSFSVSLHETDLERILATAALLDIYPSEVTILGCQPESTAVALGLSPSVERAVPEIIDMILSEII